jgi:hypothetical protein
MFKTPAFFFCPCSHSFYNKNTNEKTETSLASKLFYAKH